jgi:GxxExxY protein
MIQQVAENDLLTEKVIGCCFKIHSELGPGFNEKIYHNALKCLFNKEKIRYLSEKEFDVIYLDIKLGNFRVDFLIEDKVIIELKSVTGITPKLFERQLISYLKAANLHIGLLVNFGNNSCQIRRLVY